MGKFKRELVLYVLAYLVLGITSTGCNYQGKTDRNDIEIRGIYGSPVSFWKNGISMADLNVNAVFLNWKLINSDMMGRAEREGLKVFAEFPALNGKGYVENHPEAWAIDRYGNRVEAASWFMGVCPTEPGFREYRMNELRALLEGYSLDGIFLDYVHWHAQFEEPEPILPETCFCSNCIRNFEASTGIDVPDTDARSQADWILSGHDREWRDWRCSVIAEWVDEARSIVKGRNDNILLGLYHCPWNDEEFDGARYRILGLDYDRLKEITDVFSPMVYHRRMGREPEWVRENIDWFSNRIGARAGSFPKIWTIVQAYDDPVKITPEEFERVLEYGLSGESSGIMMFTSIAVSQSREKTETMKRVYSGLMDNK